MAKTQQYPQPPPDPDLLAAVVLHTLVSRANGGGMTAAQVAVACERDPDDRADMEEVDAALELLLGDGLAEREARGADAPKRAGADEGRDDLFRPTRAAVRATELSF